MSLICTLYRYVLWENPCGAMRYGQIDIKIAPTEKLRQALCTCCFRLAIQPVDAREFVDGALGQFFKPKLLENGLVSECDIMIYGDKMKHQYLLHLSTHH